MKKNSKLVGWVLRNIHNILAYCLLSKRGANQIIASLCFISMLTFLQVPTYSQSLQNSIKENRQQKLVKTTKLQEIKQFARRNNIKLDEKGAVYGYLNEDEITISVPAAGFDKQDKNSLEKGFDAGVIYLPNSVIDQKGKDIPSGIYLVRAFKKAEGQPTSQLIRDGKVIAEGAVLPSCDKSAQSGMPINKFSKAVSNDTPVLYASNNGTHKAGQYDFCGTKCYLFVMYCQIEYSGGYCSGRYYWCGACFGFW